MQLLFSKKEKQLEAQMDSAENYEQWSAAARAHDELTGANKWKALDPSKRYDYAQIRTRLDTLRNYRARHDDHGLLFSLNEGIHGNMGGMGSAKLYERAKFGTKNLIEDYVDEIVSALQHIAQLDDSEISREEKLDFFHRASHCYGRTALMLSGGGALGSFHVGVVKALAEHDLGPNVISGSSAGSLITAVLGTHSDEELLALDYQKALIDDVKAESGCLNRILFAGTAQLDIAAVEGIVARLVPDLTFQEAYDLTGRNINISIAPADLHQTSRLLNAVASPNVFIRTAVMASCAVPGVFPAVMLEAKNAQGERQPYLATRRWVDGSVSDDLPAKRLARLYGVNHYIGSLINPIVLFSKDGEGDHARMPQAMRSFIHKQAAGLVKLSRGVSQRYTSNWPRFNVMLNMFNSILNQEYTADITVYPDFRKFDLRKILGQLSEEEVLQLERQGELATWRQLERIRTSSLISKTLDDILEAYGEEELRHVARKSKGAKAKSSKLAPLEVVSPKA